MTGLATALPRHTWLWIYRKTLLIVGASVVGSVIATVTFMDTFSAGVNLPGLLIAILIPIFLGGPMTLIYAIGTERMRHANSQLLRLATLDGLTGLLNRRAFAARVDTHCRQPGACGVLLILDADHFKSVNDRFGHDQGDEALRQIARAIDLAVAERGDTGRLGGEEFGVYLPGADLAAAGSMADELRKAVAEIHFEPQGKPHPLSVSIGGADHAAACSFRDLYRSADDLLYSAKHEGRDRVVLPEAA